VRPAPDPDAGVRTVLGDGPTGRRRAASGIDLGPRPTNGPERAAAVADEVTAQMARLDR
jgi:hypothetical protein